MYERVSFNGLCFPGASMRELAAHWRDLGARRVSFVAGSLFEEGLPAVRAALASGDWRLETITHLFLGQRPLSQTEAWGEARAQLDEVIRAVETLGGRSIYMLTGGHGTLTWEEAAEAFCEAIAPCVARARDAGVRLLIEPAGALYADLHIAHSLSATVRLAEMAGIGVNFDVYTCWTEPGLKESVERAMPRCELIQVSDYVLGDRAMPSRAVPGDGTIPLERILGWALDAGYAGAFDLELLGPRIDKEGRVEACRRAAAWVEKFLAARGG